MRKQSVHVVRIATQDVAGLSNIKEHSRAPSSPRYSRMLSFSLNSHPAFSKGPDTSCMATNVELDFVRLQLQTGITMLNLAHTERELPDRKGAAQAITNARKALASARRFLFALANIDAGTTDQLGIEITKLSTTRYGMPCPASASFGWVKRAAYFRDSR
jgi:hypothetical protein